MSSIIQRLDHTLAKAIDAGEPATEILLDATDLLAFDAAVKASAVIQDPAAVGRGYKGVPVKESATVSHIRTVGSARFGWRPRSIELADPGDGAGPAASPSAP